MISGAGVVDEFDNQLNDAGQYDNPQDPASLSLVEHIRALSVRGKLTLVYIVFVLIYLLFRKGWVSVFYSDVYKIPRADSVVCTAVYGLFPSFFVFFNI